MIVRKEIARLQICQRLLHCELFLHYDGGQEEDDTAAAGGGGDNHDVEDEQNVLDHLIWQRLARHLLEKLRLLVHTGGGGVACGGSACGETGKGCPDRASPRLAREPLVLTRRNRDCAANDTFPLGAQFGCVYFNSILQSAGAVAAVPCACRQTDSDPNGCSRLPACCNAHQCPPPVPTVIASMARFVTSHIFSPLPAIPLCKVQELRMCEYGIIIARPDQCIHLVMHSIFSWRCRPIVYNERRHSAQCVLFVMSRLVEQQSSRS